MCEFEDHEQHSDRIDREEEVQQYGTVIKMLEYV